MTQIYMKIAYENENICAAAIKVAFAGLKMKLGPYAGARRTCSSWAGFRAALAVLGLLSLCCIPSLNYIKED